MLSDIRVDKVLALALCGGGNFAEIFAEETTATTIIHEDRKLEHVTSGIDSGYGIRVIKGEKTLYGFTNDPEKLFELASMLG